MVASDLPEHSRDVLRNLDIDKVIEDLMIKDENGEDAVEVIVASHTAHAHASDQAEGMDEWTIGERTGQD